MSDTPDSELTLDSPLDIQHDTDPAAPARGRHIPHLGHALLFAALVGFFLIAGEAVALLSTHTRPEDAMKHPGPAALGELIGYIAALAVAVPLFRAIWKMPFAVGLDWNWRAARTHWKTLLALGIVVSIAASTTLERFVKTPQHSDVELLLKTPLMAWLTAIFGSTVAPLMEEIAFRGFALPAIAIAYDWLTLKRSPAIVEQWRQSSAISLPAWIFASLFTSLAFAAMHAPQLHYSWTPVAFIGVASLIFCAVRVRFRSVAASFLVHFAYDGIIFVLLAIASRGFTHLDKIAQ